MFKKKHPFHFYFLFYDHATILVSVNNNILRSQAQLNIYLLRCGFCKLRDRSFNLSCISHPLVWTNQTQMGRVHLLKALIGECGKNDAVALCFEICLGKDTVSSSPLY